MTEKKVVATTENGYRILNPISETSRELRPILEKEWIESVQVRFVSSPPMTYTLEEVIKPKYVVELHLSLSKWSPSSDFDGEYDTPEEAEEDIRARRDSWIQYRIVNQETKEVVRIVEPVPTPEVKGWSVICSGGVHKVAYDSLEHAVSDATVCLKMGHKVEVVEKVR